MSCGIRAIAERMDTEFPAMSLRALIDQHPPLGTGSPSARALCDWHDDSQTLHLLFQNTFLLTLGEVQIGCDYPIGPFLPLYTVDLGGKPAVPERARQFGCRLAEAGYDVVALSEVFKDDVRDNIIAAWEARAPLAGWQQGPSHPGRPPDLPLPHPCPPSPVPPHIGGHAAVRGEYGNSGLLTMVRRHPVVDVDVTRFREIGSPLHDSDALAAKGVLKVSLDVGAGVVSVFSTHAYAGGGFGAGELLGVPQPDDFKDAVKRAQFRQLAEFVKQEQTDHPERYCIVGGDFNRDGHDVTDSRYRELLDIMRSAKLYDLWYHRAIDPTGAVTYGPTTIAEKDTESTRARCAVGPRSDRHCDERAPSEPGERIDYVFVQAPDPAHTLEVAFQRPRRAFFEMDPVEEGMAYLSDHLGIEAVMYVRPR